MPILESVVALSAAGAVTSRLRLGLGVLIAPLRPTAWIAKQVSALQVISGGRLLLGVGVGGDRHDTSWAAVGVPRRDRGRRLDAALDVLPAWIQGAPAVAPDGDPDAPALALPPGLLAAAPGGRRLGRGDAPRRPRRRRLVPDRRHSGEARA